MNQSINEQFEELDKALEHLLEMGLIEKVEEGYRLKDINTILNRTLPD
jgi:hypothetical protein